MDAIDAGRPQQASPRVVGPAARAGTATRTALAWRHPSLYDLYFRLSPWAAGLRRRELVGVLSALDLLCGGDDHVLEVGCGPGTYTFPIAARCARVLAVDPSPAMMRRARRRSAVDGVANVEVRPGRLPDRLPRGPFDGVVVAGVLDYMDDLQTALTGVAAGLRPGGWAVVTVPLALPSARTSRWRRARRRRAEEIVNAAVAAGLVIRRLESVGVDPWRRTLVVTATVASTASCARCADRPPLAATPCRNGASGRPPREH